ncbi:PAS domain-containing protein [Aquincola tertiaricarbonis]|uniref:histidine kinase n=1 Tax=Aquincola tertiaricarbonis TaxID=391953 RepID=A0ABY4S5C4_AQUTE|nr:PAS domain-containing protein [Aquincola tertiaricarbonis]URI08194.1 PAS domain-containing protein [Aquincola tertiaricarbonis]
MERAGTMGGAVGDGAPGCEAWAQVMPTQMWTATPDGRLNWANDRVVAYTGLPMDELIGQGWAQVIHPVDLPEVQQRWSQAITSGEPHEVEYRMRRADGEYRWHLSRAVPARDAQGGISQWMGSSTDIHELRLAEARSLRDRDRIWTLSQELMLVCDYTGHIRAVNPAATRILGWEEGEMVGRTVADFLHPDDLARTADEVGRLAGGATTAGFENRYRARDGSFRLLNWTAVPDSGFIHAVARDVTRERATEEALRQAQKMEAVGQLTGGVAHDFNNLLTIIRTSIDLMQRRSLSPQQQQRCMGSIANAVSRAARLTGQLLAFARRQALQPVSFDASGNVRAIGEMIQTLVGARILVEVQIPDTPCTIHADPSQFDTALVNMAVNARDAMDGEGRLLIRVRQVRGIPALRAQPAMAGDFVAVSLTDSGAGIAAEHLDAIFEPFFTTKPVGLGTGLGLSQVFGFARQSNGAVHVDSVAGEGATFTLYLPQHADGSRSAESDETEASQPEPPAGGCVLVVEDNAEVAASVHHTLGVLGYSAVLAHSARAALAELARDADRFTAVFSDVVMAGMDGIELAREIRRLHPGLPIVLSSGYSKVLADDTSHGFELLPKPYSLDALSHLLQAATRERLLRSEATRLQELDALGVLDTDEEVAYDELTRLAATFFDAPVALISLVDRDRQWFKSRVGLQIRETPREDAFCTHAIQQPQQVMVVNDAHADPRFQSNRLVTGEPHIRFYAGAPLVTPTGNAIGTLCVIDYQPREVDARQMEMLQYLAAKVMQRLEQRRRDR